MKKFRSFLIITFLLVMFLAINASIYFLGSNNVKKAKCIHLEVGQPVPAIATQSGRLYVYRDIDGGILCEAGDLPLSKIITD